MSRARHASHRTRRARSSGLWAAVAATLTLALGAQGSVVTDATWKDNEWVTADASTSSCEVDSTSRFATRAEGRVLSGSLLTYDLDTIAEARGVVATNNGERSIRDPSTAPEVGTDAYANPLDVEALQLAEVGLTGFLELPLDTEAGVVNQYARATHTGVAVGAAGTVGDDGGISLEQYEGDVPDLATVKLSALLNSPGIGLGSLLQDVTDLELTIGAVAGRAWLDGCRDIWGADDAVTRDYVTSHLDLDLTSPTVGALGATISSTVGTLEAAADALVGDENALDGVLEEVLTLLVGVVGTVTNLVLPIRLLRDDATASIVGIDLDLDPVRALIDEPIADDDGVVSVTLSEGFVHIDTVALLGAAYDPDGPPEAACTGDPYSQGLNGLAPNTEPLADECVLTALTTRLGTLLEGIVADVNTALEAALDNAEVTAEIRIPVERCNTLPVLGACLSGWTDAGDLLIQVQGSLTELLANASGTVTIDTSALLGGVLGGLVDTLVSRALGVLSPVLGGLVGNVVLGALGGLAQLPADVITTTVNPIVDLVGGVYEDLFLDGVVAVTINAQNHPQSGHPEPADWAAIATGRYDVAAIRVGLLDAVGASAVWLYLGRGSVEPTCSLAQAPQLCAAY